MIRLSLLWKALAVVVFVFALTTTAVAFSSAWQVEENLTREFEIRGAAIANGLASSSVDVFLFRDVSSIQAMIDQFMELEGVGYVFVVNRQGEILAHTFVPRVPAEVRELSGDNDATTILRVGIEGKGDFIDIASPILGGEVGYVHVGMDRQLIRDAIRAAVVKQLLLLGLLFLLSLVLAFVLMGRIVRPLRKLTAYAQTLATSGALAGRNEAAGEAVRSISGRRDEVGQLALAFRFLIEQVTAREGELRKAHAELELRVQERTAELTDANDSLHREVVERKRAEERLNRTAAELARSNTELEQFAFIASHDLQEPLRKVQTFGDMLIAQYHETLGDEGRDYLQRMQNASKRMQGLINDLLTYSRVTSKGNPFQEVNLTAVARQVVGDLEARIRETGGQVEVGELPKLHADPIQMGQLLQNLIGNALKYHRKGEPPVVKVRHRMLTQEGVFRHGTPPAQLCELAVEDNGIGFDEKYLDRIFKPFQRLHSRGQYEGTGMGLAICRKIVERHAGTITARSIPGQGCTFIVVLPVQQPMGGPSHE